MSSFPRRVHFIGYGLHPPWSEGTRVVTRDQMLAMSRSGVPVDAFSTRSDGETPAADLDVSYVRESVVGDLVEWYGGYRYNRDMPMLARLAWRLARGVRGATEEVIHAGFASHTVYSLVTKAVGEATFVAQTFGGIEHTRALDLLRTPSRIDAYVSSSRADLRSLQRSGILESKTRYVPPVIFPDRFGSTDADHSRRLLGIDPDNFVVGYFGNVNEARFPYAVARRLNRIAGDEGVSAVVVTKQIEDRDIRRLENLQVVCRELSTEEKRTAYAAADVWVFPFQFETERTAPVIDPPLTVLEAMASGRAVVVPEVLSLPEFVTGDNGIVVESSSPSAFLDAVESLRSDLERRERMGQRARQTVKEQFGPESLVETLLDVYHEARNNG